MIRPNDVKELEKKIKEVKEDKPEHEHCICLEGEEDGEEEKDSSVNRRA
jgi:hypothetical protein